MGQEQSYSHSSGTQVRRYHDKYEDPTLYRHSTSDFRELNYQQNTRARRSVDSCKSDNSSIESSGYRSGSNSYSASERSAASEYYQVSLYKNDHYKDINKELYRPIKIPKEKRYKLQIGEDPGETLSSVKLTSYISDTEKAKLKASPAKKAGIRNYTPKILSEDDKTKKLDNWM